MKPKLIILSGAALSIVAFVTLTHFQTEDPPAVSEQGVAPLPESAIAFPSGAQETSLPASAVERQTTHFQWSNSVARWLRDEEQPRLSLAQLDTYLAENRRSAASLLAAFCATGDQALLQEALEKYPDDPRVNFAAALNSGSTSAARRQALDALKQSAPDNVLANYLSAWESFKSEQPDAAIRELVAANGKSHVEDYSFDFLQNVEEAYRAAGYQDAEAKAAAFCSVPLPQFAELRQLGRKLVELASSARQAGDDASAQAFLQLGLNLGQHLNQPGAKSSLLQSAVGSAIEIQVLGAMDPAAPWDSGQQTVKSRLDEVTHRSDWLKTMARQSGDALEQFSDQDLISYLDRVKIFGELEAISWAMNKRGQ